MIRAKDFEKFLEDEHFLRADPDNVLNLYYGISSGQRPTLLLKSSIKPHKLISTRSVEVAHTSTKDEGEWMLSFILTDNDLLSVFVNFCNDMISSTHDIDNEEEALSFFENRYESWRKMLAAGVTNYMSDFQIQGLLGEFQFLFDYMIPKYGIEEATQSWIGPQKAAQDFVVNDTWYEIKTISSRVEKVTISSLSQLDSLNVGDLVIYRADKTSVSDVNAVNLNGQFKQLMTMLEDYPELAKSVQHWLLGIGYTPSSYYDDHVYSFKGKTFYQVISTFPALRRRDVPEAIIGAKYDISIPSLESFKINEE
jgi:hypothetical protein